MDEHNNALGSRFGLTASTYQECKDRCMEAVQSGQAETYETYSTPGYWDDYYGE